MRNAFVPIAALTCAMACSTQASIAVPTEAGANGSVVDSSILPEGGDSMVTDGNSACSAFAAKGADRDTFSAANPEYTDILKATQPDAQGFLGRNHQYSEMLSARFQEGAGLAVRIGVSVGDQALTTNAFHGVEAGMATVAPSGEVVSKYPVDADAGLDGGVVDPNDEASAAAFFLGDACLGGIAALHSPTAWNLASRANAIVAPAKLAIDWLLQQEQLLMKGDADAPNRLLFDARAFGACGVFTGDAAATAEAAAFVQAAAALQNADGVFLEKGGSDTNYQSFSVRNGYDLLTVADGDTCQDLFPRLLSGAAWLAGRVGSDGTVNSTANTRTCGGCETFFGTPKGVSLTGLFEATVSVGSNAVDASVVSAGTRAADYLIAHPAADTCVCDGGACPACADGG